MIFSLSLSFALIGLVIQLVTLASLRKLLDAMRTKPPRPKRVEVAALIGNALDKCDVPSAVAVKLEIPEATPALRVDPSQMYQVLWNLITNGVEAMPEGGELEIRAREDPVAKTVTVSIRDSGSGIKPEHQVRLFQPMVTIYMEGKRQ